MANFIVRHLTEFPLYRMKDMSLPELDETDSWPFEESIRKRYLGWLQSQTDRAKRYLQHVLDLVEEARRRGAHPGDVPVGQNRHC
eukprot:6457519-Karenia_brevis.AAC.1